jgi:ABC-2 type transport system permease protein
MYDFLLFVRMFLIQALLYTAYGSIFLMTAFLIKNIGGTMAFNVFFSLILSSLSSMVGDSYLGRILLLMNFSPTAMPHPLAKDISIAIAAALSYLILCGGIGGFIFKKQDIK